MTVKKTRIYFLTAAPLGMLPSQRFRFEHYLPYLEAGGIEYHISPYFTPKRRDTFYKSKNPFTKFLMLFRGYLHRIRDLFKLASYDIVYVHREATPVGPPVFEWIIARIQRKKIIYDFDDAIWVPTMSEDNKKYRFARSFSKIGKICSWARTVTVGNQFLGDYASKFAKDVRVIKTVVNTKTLHSGLQNQNTDQPQVGWTGSFTTLKYLHSIVPVLKRLQEEIDFTFFVIADRDPQLPLENYEFVAWNRDSEREDLLRFHIGLMPLTDTEISKGKCGFKAIQYMALGIPAIVSPVGVNAEIVDDGVNGFVCNKEEEWENSLRVLLNDKELRTRMGIAARKKIEENYSVESEHEKFLNLFKN